MNVYILGKPPEKVFRFNTCVVALTLEELMLAEDSFIQYNNQLVSLDIPVQEREDLLQLIRKFRKLKEEI